MSKAAPVVLITGCSTGIGHASAFEFLRSGWTVIATARRLETLKDLTEAGCHGYYLDVTEEASITATLSEVREHYGTIDVLVNNAGYGVYGPVEQLATAHIVRLFETNVFGLIRVSQLVLPMMRAQHRGRIINVSSIAGRMSLPLGGAYNASKHAVEAFSDALRYELKSHGISVSLVEPGPSRTSWTSNVVSLLSLDEREGDDPYREMKSTVRTALSTMTTGFGHLSSSPEHVARVIVRAASSRHPKTRYRVGLSAKLLLVVRWICPDRVFDAVIARTFVAR